MPSSPQTISPESPPPKAWTSIRSRFALAFALLAVALIVVDILREQQEWKTTGPSWSAFFHDTLKTNGIAPVGMLVAISISLGLSSLRDRSGHFAVKTGCILVGITALLAWLAHFVNPILNMDNFGHSPRTEPVWQYEIELRGPPGMTFVVTTEADGVSNTATGAVNSVLRFKAKKLSFKINKGNQEGSLIAEFRIEREGKGTMESDKEIRGEMVEGKLTVFPPDGK